MWPFDWPPKAACRDARLRRQTAQVGHQRLVFAVSHVTAVGALRAPPNRTASTPCASVTPCLRVETVSSVSSADSTVDCCNGPLVAFYESLGFARVTAKVVECPDVTLVLVLMKREL